MKKIYFFYAFLLAVLVLPQATLALSPPMPIEPIQPNVIEKINPTITPIKTGIKLPSIDPNIVFDPSLIPEDPTGPITIDPDILNNFKPLPFDPLIIPPELLKGPTISDVQILSDGMLLQVTWKTDKAATSKISYGATTSYDKALEDLNMTTQHGMVFPIDPGTWHLQIISQDSMHRDSMTPDVTVIIAQAANTANSTTSNELAVPELYGEDTEEPSLIATNVNEAATELPMIKNETEAKPVFSTAEIILGGIALLLAGTLIGILLNRPKSKRETSEK